MKVFVLSFLLASVLWTASLGQSMTPGSYRGFMWQPYAFSIGSCTFCKTFAEHQKYIIDDQFAQSDSNAVIVTTVETFVSQISGQQGIADIITHGSPEGCAIEAYPVTRYSEAWTRYNYLQQHGYIGKVYWAFTENRQHEIVSYHIGLYYSAQATYSRMSEGLVDLMACHSGDQQTTLWTGARAMVVVQDSIPPQEVAEIEGRLWESLDGGRGLQQRQLASAVASIPPPSFGSIHLLGNGQTTLAPAISYCSANPNDPIPGNHYTDVTLISDTSLDTTVPAIDCVTTSGSTIDICSASWADDTTLQIQLHGAVAQFGTSFLVARTDRIHSANNPQAQLDGSGEGGPDDWTVPLMHGQDPAAQVYGFRVNEDGLATWDAMVEYQTDHYQIEGKVGDSWDTIVIVPAGQGHYQRQVSPGYALYRLVEVETDGGELVQGMTVAGPNLPARPDSTLTTAELRHLLDERAERPLRGQSVCRSGDT